LICQVWCIQITGGHSLPDELGPQQPRLATVCSAIGLHDTNQRHLILDVLLCRHVVSLVEHRYTVFCVL
jgi:hypothetical protein